MSQQIGSTRVIRAVPAVDTAIHAAGDVVAVFDITPIDGRTGGGVLKNISVFDDSGQADLLTFLFFDGALAGTYTLNAAPAPAAADKLAFLGGTTFTAADWKTAGGDSYGCRECAIALKHVPQQPGAGGMNAAGPLTVVVLAGATPTYAALALKLAFGVLPDGN